MAIKIISFIFVISLAFSFPPPTRIKDMPFDVNEIVNRVSRHSITSNPRPTMPDFLTNEFLIDTNVGYVPALSLQSSPSIAFDGTNYMVVWVDDRSGYSDIFCARVNQLGVILDTVGIPISTTIGYQNSPSICFDSLNYFVVWADERITYDYNIYGTRISKSGVVLDTAGIAISNAANQQWQPSVSFDGTNYMVVWMDNRDYSWIDVDIYGARISTSGIVLDPNGIAISTAPDDQEHSCLAFDGTNYLVVWEDYRNDPLTADIYGARVNQSGSVLDPEGIVISTARYEQILPSVAFDGTDYLVVWEDCRNASRDIYGARVTQTGTVFDTNGIEISTASNYQYCPAVAFDGTNYLVVWEEYSGYDGDIHGARVSPYGIVLDTISIAITNDTISQGKVNICFDGTNYLVVWQDYRNDPFSWDFYGAIVNPSGIVVDSFAVSLQPGNQLSPALVHGAGNQMLITYTSWTESINGNPANAMRIWGKFYPFVGISEGNLKGKMQSAKIFEVYPNPAKGVMRVRGPFSEKTVKVFDVVGKLVKVAEKVTSAQEHKQEVKVSLKGINPGIYFLQVGKEVKKFLVVK